MAAQCPNKALLIEKLDEKDDICVDQEEEANPKSQAHSPNDLGPFSMAKHVN